MAHPGLRARLRLAGAATRYNRGMSESVGVIGAGVVGLNVTRVSAEHG
jgi:hypothetical protein